MDLNVTILTGTLAAPPEFREFESGAKLLRLLVTSRSELPRRRIDVLPVTLWDPPTDLVAAGLERGRRVWVCGSAQRRFWDAKDGRRSRVELVADLVIPGEECENGAA